MHIEIPELGPVSAILAAPSHPVAGLVLAHGAGAGMSHVAMENLSRVLNQEGIATLRFQFPYMEKKIRRPDSPAVAVAAIKAATQFARQQMPKLKWFAGGKSFGGRMTTTAASLGELEKIHGIVCFGFPLHPPKEPGLKRAEHLKAVKLPMLWVQGTRDPLADLKLVKKVVKATPLIELQVIEGADHSYGVLKSLGRTGEDVLTEVSCHTRAFCQRVK